jgi:hypothetical protein
MIELLLNKFKPAATKLYHNDGCCRPLMVAVVQWRRPCGGSIVAAAPIKSLFAVKQVQTCLNAF